MQKSGKIVDNFFLLAGDQTGVGIVYAMNFPKIQYLLMFSTLIFFLGIIGIFFSMHNIIVMLMSVEIMFLGLILDFLFISNYHSNSIGYIFVLTILTVAASESVIVLAILLNIYKIKKTINLKRF